MTNEEVEKKIKEFKDKIKSLELSIARDEEKLKTKEEEQNKILMKLQEIYPEFKMENLDQEMKNIESQLEADIKLFENELNQLENKIKQN